MPEHQVFDAYEDKLGTNGSKGFWGVLAQKAKAIIEEDNLSQQFETSARSRFQMPDTSAGGQVITNLTFESHLFQ